MCTALQFNAAGLYFGRNLDLDRSFGEEVCVLARRFPLSFRCGVRLEKHYALIGMAAVLDGVPLFYDGANEHGLAAAGLNFPENAHYMPPCSEKTNIAPFEFIPWILSQCKSVGEVKELLRKLSVVNTAFSPSVQNSPLHFIICAKDGSVVVEPMRDGLHIYDNPVGVLTNNPPFPYQLENLELYRGLRTDNGGVEKNELPYSDYCQGLGALGLPGDLSSKSRFVRMCFGRENSVKPSSEGESVGQFFRLLSSVEMVKGLCTTDSGTLDYTMYSSCINTDKGRYYYTTYGNRRISCVDMFKEDIDGGELIRYPLSSEEDISSLN